MDVLSQNSDPSMQSMGREGRKEAHLSVRGTQPAAARSGAQDFSAGCSLHRHRHSCLRIVRSISFSADECTIVDAERVAIRQFGNKPLLCSDRPLRPRSLGIPRHGLPRSSTFIHHALHPNASFVPFVTSAAIRSGLGHLDVCKGA